MPKTRKLRVFICHASQDKPTVRELYKRLGTEAWIDPWLDEDNLLPGQDWRISIEKALESTDSVIFCLSNNSVRKEGYIQKEMRYAQEIALEKPDETIFIIPLRIENCEVPRGLRFLQWADYFGERKESKFSDLLSSLKLRLDQVIQREKEEGSEHREAERFVHPDKAASDHKIIEERVENRLKLVQQSVEDKDQKEAEFKTKQKSEEFLHNQVTRKEALTHRQTSASNPGPIAVPIAANPPASAPKKLSTIWWVSVTVLIAIICSCIGFGVVFNQLNLWCNVVPFLVPLLGGTCG